MDSFFTKMVFSLIDYSGNENIFFYHPFNEFMATKILICKNEALRK